MIADRDSVAAELGLQTLQRCRPGKPAAARKKLVNRHGCAPSCARPGPSWRAPLRRVGAVCVGAAGLVRLALTRLLRRFEHAAAAARRSAAAREDFIDVGRIIDVALDLIVVRQLLARLNGAQRFDEDTLRHRDALAIRIAAVIDVARIVAVGAAVDDGVRIDREQERVAVGGVLAVIALVGFPMADSIAAVFDDVRAFADSAQREYPIAVNAASDALRSSVAGARACSWKPQTAIGALIAGWCR